MILQSVVIFRPILFVTKDTVIYFLRKAEETCRSNKVFINSRLMVEIALVPVTVDSYRGGISNDRRDKVEGETVFSSTARNSTQRQLRLTIRDVCSLSLVSGANEIRSADAADHLQPALLAASVPFAESEC